MMAQLLVKSGVKQLHLFQGKGFPYFEAYLSFNDRLDDLLNTSMKLISIHMPAFIEVNGIKQMLDFCDEGVIGKLSFEKLNEIIDFSNKHDVKFIVIHLGFFNTFSQDRNKIIDKIAAKFNRLKVGKVKLCLENVPSWTDLSFEKEPVISNEEHILYFKKKCPKFGCVFDVEHTALNTVFNYFYPKFKKKYGRIKNKESFKEEMERGILAKVNYGPIYFSSLIDKAVVRFLSSLQPDIVHAMGSDFCNYRLVGQLPLVGEALPLNYKGKIKGYKVEDRLNHSLWLSLLKEDAFIVLEVYLRDEYDYTIEAKNSSNFILAKLSTINLKKTIT